MTIDTQVLKQALGRDLDGVTATSSGKTSAYLRAACGSPSLSSQAPLVRKCANGARARLKDSYCVE